MRSPLSRDGSLNVLAVHNLKGGVGKTASAVNLAWLAARSGYKTLLWDLDPQGAASFYFRIKPKLKGGLGRLLGDSSRVRQVIKATDYERLDLLPADASFHNLDIAVDAYKKPHKSIGRLLKPLRRDYHMVFIDCAPGLSLSAESILTAGTTLLIPTIPTPLSVRALEQVLELVHDSQLTGLDVLPFFTLVDRRKRVHVTTIQKFLHGDITALAHYIPYAADVERMGVTRQVLAQFAPRSSAALAYQSLWTEIEQRITAR